MLSFELNVLSVRFNFARERHCRIKPQICPVDRTFYVATNEAAVISETSPAAIAGQHEAGEAVAE